MLNSFGGILHGMSEISGKLQPSKILGLKLQVCEVRATLRNDCFLKNCIILHQHLDISRCKNPAIIINLGNARSTITIWQSFVIYYYRLSRAQLHLKTMLLYFLNLLLFACRWIHVVNNKNRRQASDTKIIINLFKCQIFVVECQISPLKPNIVG